MKVIILIADIIASKEIEDRNRIQKKLLNEISRINRESVAIISPMTITLGDEFQCVYSNADEIFKHIWAILNVCYPEQIRFSYGLGTITTDINKEQAIGMDGPAFYEAREGMNQLKKQKDSLFNIRAKNNDDIITLIRNLLYLISYNVENWKKNRIQIMNMLTAEMPVKLISEKLQISEQAVYKNITNGGLQPILDITKSTAGILNNLIKN